MSFSNQASAPASDVLTADHVRWAYRLLLDREPESDAVIEAKLAGSADARQLRHHLMTSAEFREKNPDYAHTNDRVVVVKELEASGPRLFVDLSDHAIGLAIVRDRYEREEIDLVRGLLKPADVAVDIGAHIGFFSMHMADAVGAGGHVYSFEPFPSNADLFERSVGENHYEDRVTLRRCAAGAAAGHAQLSFARETLNTGGAYLIPAGAQGLPGNESLTVEVVALDDLPLRRPVRFMKMDAEGAEPQVLAGAQRLIGSDRPVILTELHPAQLDRVSRMTPSMFLDVVRRFGYQAHTISEARPGPPLSGPVTSVTSVLLLPA